MPQNTVTPHTSHINVMLPGQTGSGGYEKKKKKRIKLRPVFFFVCVTSHIAIQDKQVWRGVGHKEGGGGGGKIVQTFSVT